MARRRKPEHAHLPQGVYEHRGIYFWRNPANNEWTRLGKTWDRDARAKWVELSTGKATAEGTVGEMLDSFLVYCEGEVRAGRRSMETHKSNLGEAEMLKAIFGRMQYGLVNSKHAARYLRKRTDKQGVPAPIRANREIALLSSAYSWAMGDDRYDVTVNPCYGVRRNRESPRVRYVRAEELRQFERHGPRWLRCYIMLKRLTAMRQGNLLRLTDANLTARGIDYVQNKRGKHRLVAWSPSLRRVINAILALRPAIPEGVAALPRPLFMLRRTEKAYAGRALTKKAFKSEWYRTMERHMKDGGERFVEHDIRAKSGSDAESDERAAELLGDTVKTAQKHYRRGVSKVTPLR
jgi:integrase